MATKCPVCNKRVPDGVDVCGNCGNYIDRGEKFVQIAPSGTYGEQSSSPALDEHGFARDAEAPAGGLPSISVGGSSNPPGSGGTFIPVGPIARRRSILPIVVVLLVVGGVGLLANFVGSFVDSTVDNVREGVEDFDFGNNIVLEEEALPEGSYEDIRALAKDLQAAGVTCRKVKVHDANEFTSSGTCQSSERFPLTILMFFDTLALDATRGAMDDGGASYVHDANWFVITPTKGLAREIHKAVGGELYKGTF